MVNIIYKIYFNDILFTNKTGVGLLNNFANNYTENLIPSYISNGKYNDVYYY